MMRIKTRFLLHIYLSCDPEFPVKTLNSESNQCPVHQAKVTFFLSRNQQRTNLGSKLMDFSFQNPISSGKIPKDFYNIPQMARANSRVQHINIQQDESIFISWNLIIYQKKERTKRDIEEIKPMYWENRKWITVSYILERQQKRG